MLDDPPTPPKPDAVPELPSGNAADPNAPAATAKELARRRRGRSQLTIDPGTQLPSYGTGIALPK